ncbi:hypothetical protein ACF1G0_26160 [Streptomyces sp. NPDC013953]|uniref:hypothetical protein n=1 Tax=Streptomyces sp. NPDC013953 TaxID=3364868 RepID=UPI0036FA49A9
MRFEQVFTYAWPYGGGAAGATPGTSVLSVAHEPAEEGTPRRWLLLAGLPHVTELLPFDDAAQVRAFARAVLGLRSAPAAHEHELHEFLLGEEGPEEERFATLRVGRDRGEGTRAFFTYRSYVAVPGRPEWTSPGLEVVCRDVEVDRARAEARALLAELDGAG